MHGTSNEQWQGYYIIKYILEACRACLGRACAKCVSIWVIYATITAKELGAQPNRKMKVTTTTPSGLKYKKAFDFLVCNCTHECGPHSCMSAFNGDSSSPGTSACRMIHVYSSSRQAFLNCSNLEVASNDETVLYLWNVKLLHVINMPNILHSTGKGVSVQTNRRSKVRGKEIIITILFLAGPMQANT